MKYLLAFGFFLITISSFAQSDSLGVITGSVMDEKKKALAGATVTLIPLADTMRRTTALTDADGSFTITSIPFGYHQMRISYVGLQAYIIDSIHFREERFDFNLNDIVLKPRSESDLQEIIVYAEKPLIQSKDGNITFNAGESALSAGSNASELLTNVPLITKDPDGKILVRGKEPKILIDDKPVELNQQQLQDLLESLPGSTIEKIEVMTNPPPQYASEQGGVINITTKKGKVGKSGRINLTGGSRGELSMNANYNYRKQGLAFNINAGAGYNQFESEGYSIRDNIHSGYSTFVNTRYNSVNKNFRPNLRTNLDFDVNPRNSFNVVFAYNQNDFENSNFTETKNFNSDTLVYRFSERTIGSEGGNQNLNSSLTYTLKSKVPGSVFKVIANTNLSHSENDRDFFLQYFTPDHVFNGKDSTQNQVTTNRSQGYSLRAHYDFASKNKKSIYSFGAFRNLSRSDISSDASYFNKNDQKWTELHALINRFQYRQDITNVRGSLKQLIGKDFSVTGGISAENTNIVFNLDNSSKDIGNQYWSYLPFANINRSWKDVLNLTLSYRRTIRRPGVNELNPFEDSTDLHNTRVGNPDLKASMSHNIDLVLGRNVKSFFANLGFGYNKVEDVYAQIRQRLTDTTTQVIWQNISDKKEYEVSAWGGYTLSKRTRVNLSMAYTYNEYLTFEGQTSKFRNGGSFTSNFNANYNFQDLYNITSSLTYNKFASPQGLTRSNLSMNLGLQAKLLEKKLTMTLNVIDPLRKQQNRAFTYGDSFTLETFNTTQTRNFRLTAAYNIAPKPKKKQPKMDEKTKQRLQKALQEKGAESKS
jgi:hypothetical protein